MLLDGIFLIFISLSLSMDCFAVSCAIAFKEKMILKKNILMMASFFGIFQFLMPLLGYTIGKFAFQWIKSLDHWIAFLILLAIGIKMIIESFEKEDIRNEVNYFHLKYLFSLTIATSLDAFGVGFTLSLLGYGIIIPILLFGFTTFIVTILGFLFGRRLKKLFGRKIEIFGGIILILIGFKILFEHLQIL